MISKASVNKESTTARKYVAASSAIEMVIGVAFIAIQVTWFILATASAMQYSTGVGIWVGAVQIATGIVGIVAVRIQDRPLVIAKLVMSSVAAFFTLAVPIVTIYVARTCAKETEENVPLCSAEATIDTIDVAYNMAAMFALLILFADIIATVILLSKKKATADKKACDQAQLL